MENELSILTTYLAGSPLPGAHHRKQDVDHNTMPAVGMFGPNSLTGRKSNIAYGGADLEILLGVNTWQHVWLRDWGVGGKKRFLEEWWEAIDWDVVEKNSYKSSGEGNARNPANASNRARDLLSGLGNVGRKK